MLSVPVFWRTRDGSGMLGGVLVLDGATLCLQYQTLDWHQGAQHPNARELRLNPEAIVHAEFRKGFLWIAPSIEIQSSDFAALATLDADQSGHLSLRLRGSHRRAAKALVAELHSAQVEVRYKRWSRDMDRMTPEAGREEEGDQGQ
ncbi:hypothetical protein OS187_04500 [Xanthomonadaceae bacterium JHOS43]|nr:hypothetical protein [Xanthomonadaceae bacterium JHOS43]